MKIIIACLALSGCAGYQPMSFEQRMAIMQMNQANRYVIPPPPTMIQTRQARNYYCNTNGYCVPQ